LRGTGATLLEERGAKRTSTETKFGLRNDLISRKIIPSCGKSRSEEFRALTLRGTFTKKKKKDIEGYDSN
jgi:hypothetical protein